MAEMDSQLLDPFLLIVDVAAANHYNSDMHIFKRSKPSLNTTGDYFLNPTTGDKAN